MYIMQVWEKQAAKMTNLHEAQSCWDQASISYHRQLKHIDSKLGFCTSFDDIGIGIKLQRKL